MKEFDTCIKEFKDAVSKKTFTKSLHDSIILLSYAIYVKLNYYISLIWKELKYYVVFVYSKLITIMKFMIPHIQ